MPTRERSLLVWVAAFLGATSLPAPADVVDLTSGPGSSGTINLAIFEFFEVQAAGTGVIAPFVRIQRRNVEQGYNTSATALPFDEKSGIWTHDLRIDEIQIVLVGGVEYFEFHLDVNEPSGPSMGLISLDDVQIYTSPTGSLNTTNLASLGTLRYDLDAGVDSHVLLDADNSSGSGEADMRALVPAANFAGSAPTDFVYFYSRFGLNETSGGGFEEWRVVLIPEPATFGLLLPVMVLLIRRRRSAD